MESCRFCKPLGDGNHQFIKKFACGNLYLNKRQHYYGYLIYVYHKHAKDFSEIDEADLLQVHQDLLYITKVVKITLRYLALYPFHNDGDDIGLLVGGEGVAGGYFMPFADTPAAAASRCVLCHKNRMPAHRRLLSVIRDNSRCKAFLHKILAMCVNSINPFLLNIKLIFVA